MGYFLTAPKRWAEERDGVGPDQSHKREPWDWSCVRFYTHLHSSQDREDKRSSDEKEYGEELCSMADEGSGLDAHWNYIF